MSGELKTKVSSKKTANKNEEVDAPETFETKAEYAKHLRKVIKLPKHEVLDRAKDAHKRILITAEERKKDGSIAVYRTFIKSVGTIGAGTLLDVILNKTSPPSQIASTIEMLTKLKAAKARMTTEAKKERIKELKKIESYYKYPHKNVFGKLLKKAYELNAVRTEEKSMKQKDPGLKRVQKQLRSKEEAYNEAIEHMDSIVILAKLRDVSMTKQMEMSAKKSNVYDALECLFQKEYAAENFHYYHKAVAIQQKGDDDVSIRTFWSSYLRFVPVGNEDTINISNYVNKLMTGLFRFARG
eukprot:CAMPEP_0119011982 /NCGR_PEP_ID=MMETSP1176-20130426/6008_1 /TAXON_ID=265551 /ORGANISM="Synedropsis recta cf, Strain CCMP1620" /LENGTH=297 /DNA_ID=CAMNT_0006964871 /DNA_START=61 /DNA_END=951 /DNA_ORIENTATION=+